MEQSDGFASNIGQATLKVFFQSRLSRVALLLPLCTYLSILHWKKWSKDQLSEYGDHPVEWGLPRERVRAKKFVPSLHSQGNSPFLKDIPEKLAGYHQTPCGV